MSDRLISWLRTVVPGLWATLFAYLVTHYGLPDALGVVLNTFWETVAYPVALGVVYGVLRKIEAHTPDWLTRTLLGSAKPPTYAG